MEPIHDGQMKPVPVAEVPLFIYRGDSAAWKFRLWADDGRTEAYDLTGATVTAQIREAYHSARYVVLLCDVELPNLVTARLGPADSARTTSGRWDMRAVWTDGRVTTLIRGPVNVEKDVTRD